MRSLAASRASALVLSPLRKCFGFIFLLIEAFIVWRAWRGRSAVNANLHYALHAFDHVVDAIHTLGDSRCNRGAQQSARCPASVGAHQSR